MPISRAEERGMRPCSRRLALAAWGCAAFCASGSLRAPVWAASASCPECHTEVKVLPPGHQGVGCTVCHAGTKDFPHKAAKPDALRGERLCRACHDDRAGQLQASVHAGTECASCHGTIHKDRKAAVQSCAACHPTLDEDYHTHAHEKKGVTCADCHGSAHQTAKASDPNSSVSPRNQSGTCDRCHAANKSP